MTQGFESFLDTAQFIYTIFFIKMQVILQNFVKSGLCNVNYF